MTLRPAPPTSVTYGYCAQVAEVAVDLDTGHVEVTRLVSVNDVGKAINPQLVEGQIEAPPPRHWLDAAGKLYPARRPHADAPPEQLSDPRRAGHCRRHRAGRPEIPDPQGPLGLRGMAEMPMIPTAPAIAAAIHNATGRLGR
ncbi:MAG: molybdopterin cofactor-binding domain-containing protein [Caldilineaceae bacterium]